MTAAARKRTRQQREQIARDEADIRRQARVARIMFDLKAERERQGLSITDLAKITGMDRAAISRLENGRRRSPGMETVMRYADALNVQLVMKMPRKSRKQT